ncbi:MAG: hypothetical protein WCB12_10700 [Bryobacteraceae bacterium]
MDRSICVRTRPRQVAVAGVRLIPLGTLGAGEQIDVEPGGWVYKDRSAQMETQFQKFSTGSFASAPQIVCNRFTGPGRVGIQSMYIHMPAGE